MTMSITIKRRMNGQWMDLPIKLVKQMTIEELVNSLDGTDAVMRINCDGNIKYACGTKELCERYKARGDSACLLSDIRAAVGSLDEITSRQFGDVFPDATLQSVVYF